jgi:hypothetical protein
VSPIDKFVNPNFQNNPPENNLAASKTICQKIMWSQFPQNLSCLQNNLSENNVVPVPAKSELPPKQSAGK